MKKAEHDKKGYDRFHFFIALKFSALRPQAPGRLVSRILPGFDGVFAGVAAGADGFYRAVEAGGRVFAVAAAGWRRHAGRLVLCDNSSMSVRRVVNF